ncbi:MAG: hypothetical protein QXE31_02800 [Candidatus Woesearchaeota archaeon]
MKRIKGYYNSSNKGVESRLLQPLRVKPKRREKQSKEQLIKRDHLPIRIENPPYEIQGNLNQWLYSWALYLNENLINLVCEITNTTQPPGDINEIISNTQLNMEEVIERLLNFRENLPKPPEFLRSYLTDQQKRKHQRWINYYNERWKNARNTVDNLLYGYGLFEWRNFANAFNKFYNPHQTNLQIQNPEHNQKFNNIYNHFFNCLKINLSLASRNNIRYRGINYAEKSRNNLLNLVDIYHQRILPEGIKLNKLTLDNFFDVFDAILDEHSLRREKGQNKHFLEELASRFSNYYFSEFAFASMVLNIQIPSQISPEQYEQIKTNLTSAYALVHKVLEKAIELKKREKHKEFYGKIADFFISYGLDILSKYFSQFLNFNAVDIETAVSNYLFLIQALPEKKKEISTIIDKSLYFEIQRLIDYNTQLNKEFKPEFYNAVLDYARKTKNAFDKLKEYCLNNENNNESNLSIIVKGGVLGLTIQYIQIAGLGIVNNLIEVNEVVQYIKSIIEEPFFNQDERFMQRFNDLLLQSTTYFAQLGARYPETHSKFEEFYTKLQKV